MPIHRLKHLHSWVLLTITFLSASLIIIYFSINVFKNVETRFLYRNITQQSSDKIDTFSSVALENIIIEDRASLTTMVNQYVLLDKNIYSLAIRNEDGESLAAWNSKITVHPDKLMSISREVTFQGEKFGSIHLSWNASELFQTVDDHINTIQILLSSILIALALVLLAWLYLVVIEPLNSINLRLAGSMNDRQSLRKPFLLPYEFQRIHQTLDEFLRIMTSKNLLENEVQVRKQAEEEAERALKIAIEANQIKSSFLANVSHELRTPLNAIIGYSEMLIEEHEGEEQLAKDLTKIHRSGAYLLQLINDILDFSKLESGKIEFDITTFNISGLLKEISDITVHAVKRNKNKLHIHINMESPQMQSDITRVRQVLLNLVNNASKFTSNGDIEIHVTDTIIGDYPALVFSVSDTGIGMTEEQMKRIFHPFTQADASTTRKFGGTGLGLTITRQLVELMGGTIDVTSKPNVGTTFTVTFPQTLTLYLNDNDHKISVNAD